MLTTLVATSILATQTPPPSVDFGSLMSRIPFTRNSDPKINIDTVDISFAPTEDFTVRAEIQANGKILATKEVLDITRVATFARVRFRGNSFSEMGSESGPRSVVVFVNDKPAGRLDMNFTKKSSGDAYNPTNEWTTTGPWQTHAYFEYSLVPGENQPISLTWWMSSREIGPNRVNNFDIVMRRGSTILAKSNVPGQTADTEISKRTSLMSLPSGQPLVRSQLEKIPGPFVLEFKQGTRIIRSYRGEIANGTFKPHKRSDLNYTDPLNFLATRFVSSSNTVSEQLRSWITTD